MVIVPGLPIVNVPQEMVDARGMVARVSVSERLPVIYPEMEALRFTDFVPSALCGMTVVPVKIVVSPPASTRT